MRLKIMKADSAYEGPVLKLHKNGDMIDLYLTEKVELKKGQHKIFSLGFACKLPKGMIAKIYPRSSTFKNTGLLLTNSVGVVDNSYNGDNDIWKADLYATRLVTLEKGERLLQMEIVPSMFSTFFQRLKWMFSGNLKIRYVDSLSKTSRGGFGEGTEEK